MKRRLAQTEHDVVVEPDNARAALAVVEEGRNRSSASTPTAPGRSSRAWWSASPIDGLVLVKENRTRPAASSSPACRCPSSAPGIWSGQAGRSLDVSDTTDLEIQVRVNEQERATLTVGQPATVTRGRRCPAC